MLLLTFLTRSETDFMYRKREVLFEESRRSCSGRTGSKRGDQAKEVLNQENIRMYNRSLLSWEVYGSRE